MTITPPPEPEEQQSPPPDRRRRWLPWVGGILVVVAAGGYLGVRFFVHRLLNPIIEDSVSAIINRPLEMGEVQRFTLTSIRFGETRVPPVPGEAEQATVAAIEAGFNPLEVIFRRSLTLDLTLIEPEARIDQLPDGAWTSLEITLPEEEGFLEIKVDDLRVRDADLILVARDADGDQVEPVTIFAPSVDAKIDQDAEEVTFELAARLLEEGRPAGEIRAEGETDYSRNRTEADVKVDRLQLPEISRLVPLPAEVLNGEVDLD